jgi:predicted transcriptional regulator
MVKHDSLPRREREILNVLFACDGHASVEDIRNRLNDPPSYSAVRAMLARLEAKGHVEHRADGLRYVYAPTASRSSARQDALRKMVRTFFRGSPSRTAAALLKHEHWTPQELDALSSAIDRVRKEKKRS